MTVNQLIAELQKWPSDMRVVVSGYEDGCDDISRLASVSVALKPNAKSFEGRWQDDEPGEPAVFLFGRGRDEQA